MLLVKFISVSIPALILLVSGMFQTPNVTVLLPFSAISTVHEAGQLFIVSAAKADAPLTVSTQWVTDRLIPIREKSEKENFPKEFLKLFDQNTSIQALVWSLEFYGGSTKADTIQFRYAEYMTVRSFWEHPAFTRLVGLVKMSSASSVRMNIRGWKDTPVQTEFEDPETGGRDLYKLQVVLIPGINSIYLAPKGDRTRATERLLRYSLETGSGSMENRFHNSDAERNCSSCHEGLPSSSDGLTMTADCASCHKSVTAGKQLHAPVEGGECLTCHSWSVEKKAIVNPDAGICLTCHGDISDLVGNAAFPHAVAGDCLTCHSPHSSPNARLTKAHVNDLCAGCHSEYNSDHPVGKHPVRFARMEDGSSEISCVSCHAPHGSENRALLKMSGQGFAICIHCHEK